MGQNLHRAKRYERLQQAMDVMPLVAILRGLTPENAVSIGSALVDGGIHILEVPLNSPEPIQSIAVLRNHLPEHIIVGAGTVRNTKDIEQLQQINADIVVMPHCSSVLIQKSIDCGLEPFPGVFTPTEAFGAIDSGARYLKIFPANCNPSLPKALASVLPSGIQMLAVGGVKPSNLDDFPSVQGFGIGSSLFKPQFPSDEVLSRAKDFCEAIEKWKLK